jgi:hypothetical protein
VKYRKVARVLALALALVVACSAAPEDGPAEPLLPSGCDREFVVSEAFTLEEWGMLDASVTRWNAIAPEQFCLRVGAVALGGSVRHSIFRIPYRGEYWQALSKTFDGADVLGVHYGDTDQIGIVDVLDAVSFPMVALHELGHAHGLDHTEAPAIMYRSIGTASDFTELDMSECMRVGACSPGDGKSAPIVRVQL